MVKVDDRGKDDILTQIKERAKSYTPEWNIDTDNPDIAAALAQVYAEMLAGTLKKVNNTPLKNKIAFFNMMNASLLPASPSEGYVSFSLSSDDVGNTEIPKGAVLTSYSDDGYTMRFETCDDILVSPARIVKAFCADDSRSFIGEYKDFGEKKTSLFGLPPENLQKHIMCIAHPYAFSLDSDGQIALRFYFKGDMPLEHDSIKALSSPQTALIEYYGGEEIGYIPFANVQEQSGVLILSKNQHQPSLMPDKDGYNIRITIKDMSKVKDLTFSYMEALPSGESIVPDNVLNSNVEYDINEFHPFGERFGLFDEVYFGSSEVLSKRGSKVTMTFDMHIVQVPIENQLEDDGINWKWIANKKDFKETKSYKIAITSVIWEYFNGIGWSRLFPDNTSADLFSIREGVTSSFKTMTFTCPDDIQETFVGAQSGYFIRARIMKAENLYKNKGWYLSPLVRNLSFEYHYENKGCRISDIVTYNNISKQVYDSVDAARDGFVPFINSGSGNRTVYLGFSAPPDSAPMRILWDIEEGSALTGSKLRWTYLTDTGWRPMNIVDETDGFSKVGKTVFLDNHRFSRKKLFGEELYWVAVADQNDVYKNKKAGLPVLKRVYFNTVGVVNVDSHNEELFAMNIYSENPTIMLSSENVLSFELYVNEIDTIREKELAKLEKECRIIRVSGSGGMDSEIWVKWNEVNTFAAENNESRCYLLDRSTGRITFGNGRKGRIPPVSDENNIKVRYTTGGGERTNIAAGTISGLERSYGFVSEAVNPKDFYGGTDTETIHEAMRRTAVMLRTQGKAITLRDLESITFSASRNIRKLRCVTGKNAAGSRESGAVTLVVLKRENSEFVRIKNEITDYLKDRLPGNLISNGTLYIVEPTFVKINVRVEIQTENINGIFELRKKAKKCLADYFAAFSGFDGDNVWRLGMVPNEQQIRSALMRLEDKMLIRKLYITMSVLTAGGLKEIDSDALENYSYILPQNGEHDISVSVV